jgi:hypothetical protein
MTNGQHGPHPLPEPAFMTFPAHAFRAASLASLFACASTDLLADSPQVLPPARREVILMGWLHVADYSFALTTVEVQVRGDVAFTVQWIPSRQGRHVDGLRVLIEHEEDSQITDQRGAQGQQG